MEGLLATIPTEIAEQIHDAAEYFAVILKNRGAGVVERIPDWMSISAQNWIVRNGDIFSKLVLSQYRRLCDPAGTGQGPEFILPDPKNSAA